MPLPLYQVDAFTRRPFRGNPAAVVPLERWLDDELLQAIALENNLSETAFFLRRGERVELRWFTPTSEVPLCGHATLASAHVLLTILDPSRHEVRFDTASGPLVVRRDGDALLLDLPAYHPTPWPRPTAALSRVLGKAPVAALEAGERNMILRYEDEATIATATPDLAFVKNTLQRDVIITARADERDEVDFVSRYFAPSVGIDEDPVTGSAHAWLTPYWTAILGRTPDSGPLHARQLSPRGGELTCELRGDRVILRGHAVLTLRGELLVDP